MHILFSPIAHVNWVQLKHGQYGFNVSAIAIAVKMVYNFYKVKPTVVFFKTGYASC